MNFALPEEAEIDLSMDMTPMIDVVFLLIIFFLASAALSVGAGDEQIELPEATEAKPAERLDPDSIILDVQWAAGGASFAVSGKAYGYDDLLRRVRVEAQSAKLRGAEAPPVILRADFRVPYKTIQQIMFDCAQAGIDRFDFQAETGGGGQR